MPVLLIVLWILTLLVAIAFFFVRRLRLQQERPSAISPPENTPPPEFDPWSQPQLRWLTAVLLAGGLLLLWLGQTLYKLVPPPQQRAVIIVMAGGAGLFLWGAHTAVTQKLPDWLAVPLGKICRYFHITGGQLALLLLAPLFSLMAYWAAGDQLLARHWPIAVLSWLISVLLVMAGSYSLRPDGDSAGQFNITKRDILFTAVIFLAALLLRSVAMNQYPTTFSGDEGSSGLHALLFLQGQATNVWNVGWFSFPSPFYVLQAAAIGLFGQTIEAVRFVSAVGGALAVAATYWLGLVMFGRVTAVLAAIYLAASHYHIHISRIALNNVWDSFWGVVTLAALWLGWKNGRRSAFILGGLALGIGQFFYVSIRVLPLLLLLWAITAFLWQRDQFKQRLPGLVLMAGVAFIVLLPLNLYFLGHPDEFAAPLNRVTLLGPRLEAEMTSRGETAGQIIGGQMLRAALGYTHEPLRLLYNPGAPLLLPGAAALFILGLLWGVTHFDLRYWLLILPLLSVIVSSGLSQDAPASQRYILAAPIVAVFAALPLAEARQRLSRLWPQSKKVVTAVALLIILGISFADVAYYFVDVYEDGYVLGGWNTAVATDIAHYLQAQEPPQQKVYFFGFPQMGYNSLSTIPYLAPDMIGEDVVEPLTAPPDWPISGPTIFIFLPFRLDEADFVQAAYPGGHYQEFRNDAGQMTFVVYELDN